MFCTFPVHPAASKYLIARAICKMPEVQGALKNGKIFIGHGTTNISVAEELLGIKVENPDSHVSGVITQQVSCATDQQIKALPWCIDKGRLVETDWLEFLNEFKRGDIFIKGANAVDPQGNVGILLGDRQGGTIGKSIGILAARGIQIINPVGLEKMIPSCVQAQKVMGENYPGYSLGLKTGYICLSNTTVITEIESLKILMDVDAVQVAAGGVGGMEGSVVLAAECESEDKAGQLMELIKKANRIPPLKINKRKCKDCDMHCSFI
jgi:hypothetical protein